MLTQYGMCAERRRDFFFFVILLLPLDDFPMDNGWNLNGFWNEVARCSALYELLGHGRCDVPSSERRDWDCTREKRMNKMMSIIKKEIGNKK